MGERVFNLPFVRSAEMGLADKERYDLMPGHGHGSRSQAMEIQLQETLKQEEDSFEPSDFLDLHDAESEESSGEENQEILVKPKEEGGSSSHTITPASGIQSTRPAVIPSQLPTEIPSNPKNKKRKSERAVRYAFKTRSESDILEDGYKWRKYGKKFVKNSPNPRNYYRCSNNNCNVKKRVERDAHDRGIVITTYEGQHNHEIPSVIYYIGKPSMVLPDQVSSFEQYPQLCYTGHIQPDFLFMSTS